jgi:signal transduction histidine kinase
MSDESRSHTKETGRAPVRGRLFRKFAILFVGLVGGVLIASGAMQAYFSYEENKEMLVRLQREKANAAATVIKQFVQEIENQIAWTMHSSFLPGAQRFEQRRIDFLRLLRQAPAITEISLLDAKGKEQLKISRLSMDVIGGGKDFSADPKFTMAKADGPYVSPVYFRQQSEPYVTLSMAGPRRSTGVTVAEVNLKLIWDEISQIRTGRKGYAYVVDARGLLIAHPDIGLVLRKTNLSALSQVKAARKGIIGAAATTGRVQIAGGIGGGKVLTAHGRIDRLGWTVFVESPLGEAFGPIYDSLARTGVLILIGLILAAIAGLVLARRITVPIRALQEGATRIGAGDLSSRIEVKTGDELEILAGQFNDMTADLRESYATLERRVEERTAELSAALEQLEALGEVGQAVSSTLDLQKVLETIVAHAVELSNSDAGTIQVHDEETGEYQIMASHGMSEEHIESLKVLEPIGRGAARFSSAYEASRRRVPVEVPEMQSEEGNPRRETALEAGFRALLAVPLLREDEVVGTLVVRRKRPGPFGKPIIDLLQTFASQSVLPIQNARLFQEIEEKGRQIEIASQHKSQFLANMSHELRTPLNAILGYTELILDEIYGPAPEKVREVLERVTTNGRHLLGLINEVLDLSKIEAGELELSVNAYSMADVVHTVVTATESLAKEKNLALNVTAAPDLPTGEGDERRIAQVLLNLVGNAIKFTDEGTVGITVGAENGTFEVKVADTGPGITANDQKEIFEEFHQIDNSNTKEKGGTGLGLAIAKRIVEMHGGRIWVESAPGEGSTFGFSVPLRATQREAAS